MEITIRRLKLADTAALSEISKKTFYDTFTGTCTPADMNIFLENYFNEQQAARELSNINDLYFFAEIDNQPVGYLRFMEDYSNFSLMKKWKAMELKRIYVLQEFHGKGVAQNDMEAINWLRKAAEQGFAGAQCKLASCYCVGRGVQRDCLEAYKWLQLAAAQGVSDVAAVTLIMQPMTSEQIAEGRRRVAAFVPKKKTALEEDEESFPPIRPSY